MKIKFFTALWAIVLVMLLGIWACSDYAGRESLKPKSNEVFQTATLPVEAQLVTNSYYIVYMSVLDDPNSTWQQAVQARDSVIINFSGFIGMTQMQIDAVMDASFDWTVDGGSGLPILIPLADLCKKCYRAAARTFERAVKEIWANINTPGYDHAYMYGGAEERYKSDIAACNHTHQCV